MVLRALPVLVAIALPAALHAQATVPFVGCPADGQIGPVSAPDGKPKKVALAPELAAKLAWYQSAKHAVGLGVLAPRGWHCFGTYGSNGASLYVAPEPLDSKQVLLHRNWPGFTGPAVQVSLSDGGTSGRFEVARIVARVFPDFQNFAQRVIAEKVEPAADFPFGPFPADQLTYPSQHTVEFTTPAEVQGLGTASWLLPSSLPIRGAVMLFPEDDMSVQQISVRLPAEEQALERVIVQQKELELLQPAAALR